MRPRVLPRCALPLCALLLAACASTPPLVPEADRATLTVAGVRWPAGGAQFGLDPDRSDSAAAGYVKGLVQGALIGLFYLPSWVVGGPFHLGPLAAREAAACGQALGEVPDAVSRLQRAGQQAGLAGLQAGLAEHLARPPAAGAEAPAQRYLLVVDKLGVELNGDYDDKDGRCVPVLELGVHWHLVRESDGQAFIQHLSYCSGPTAAASFAALLADEATLANTVTEALRRLGGELALALRTGGRPPCRL